MFHHGFRHKFRLVTGCVLLVLGSALLVHSVRAALAQRTYLRIKYGFFRGTSAEVPRLRTGQLLTASRLAQGAMETYGANYYLPAYVAQLAVARADRAKSREEFDAALELALFFSNEAYCLNPYNAEIRSARAAALELSGDMAGALAVWREAVAREYWNPRTHLELARCLLRSGTPSDLAEAAGERAFVRDPKLRRRLEKIAKLVAAP